MSAGRRQLFAYWRIEPEELAQALAAMQSWQAACCRSFPGLSAGLYVRHSPGAQVTLMETYAVAAESQPDGLSAAQLAALTAPDSPTPWPAEQRKLEVFDLVVATGG